MKIKKEDFVFTLNDCGIVKKVNKRSIILDNNVNKYNVLKKDIKEVFSE